MATQSWLQHQVAELRKELDALGLHRQRGAGEDPPRDPRSGLVDRPP
jgi:hypothetical protein